MGRTPHPDTWYGHPSAPVTQCCVAAYSMCRVSKGAENCMACIGLRAATYARGTSNATAYHSACNASQKRYWGGMEVIARFGAPVFLQAAIQDLQPFIPQLLPVLLKGMVYSEMDRVMLGKLPFLIALLRFIFATLCASVWRRGLIVVDVRLTQGEI